MYLITVIILISVAIFIIVYLVKSPVSRPVSYLPQNFSKTYIKPDHWRGTPIDDRGRFMNAEYPFYRDYIKLFKWLPGHIKSLVRNRHMIFPVTCHRSIEFLQESETLIWLGHASFLLRIANTNILVDPHFYNTVIYKRHTDNPIPPKMFTGIQYIFLSHDHADHCDKRSLLLLIKQNPGVTIISGLNMDTLLQSFTTRKLNITTMDWYEEIRLKEGIQVCFVPGRHYSARVGANFNAHLWGGFVIRYKHSSGNMQTIYYGGDSGYGNHFKDIKSLFTPDIAILPVGAYLPRWFMEPNHMSPEEAVRAFKDCGAGLMIPMHFEMFSLANEDMSAPRVSLNRILPERNLVSLLAGDHYKLI